MCSAEMGACSEDLECATCLADAETNASICGTPDAVTDCNGAAAFFCCSVQWGGCGEDELFLDFFSELLELLLHFVLASI